MSVVLSALLDGVAAVPPAVEREVLGLALDSRHIKRGDLFLAMKGGSVDGRRFIGNAISAGASAVLYESGDGYTLPKTAIPAFGVSDLRKVLGTLANRFYDSPSRRMVVVGVTGTNGKTTCTQLLAQALDDHAESGTSARPRRCAVIGTLGYGFPGALNESLHTTPDAVSVHRLMREFLDGGATGVSMEVSSHALDQGRVNEVAFDCAVFTNLTRDHLDYHGTMQAYGAAKASLFDWQTLRHAVINRDDEFGRALIEKLSGRVETISYGLEGGDVTARAIRPTATGLVLDVTTPRGEATL
jgi:UDP-N-acetylmuramoyl-L-alanyl-D-glutamate--2,6-diaminopimelate ligase